MSDWEVLFKYPGGGEMYKLDSVIAERVKELRLGLNGSRSHSWRALSIQVTGFECQMTGSDLCKAAMGTLGEEWEDG